VAEAVAVRFRSAIPLNCPCAAPVAIWAIAVSIACSVPARRSRAGTTRRSHCRRDAAGAPFRLPSLPARRSEPPEAPVSLLQECAKRLLDQPLSDTECAAGSGQIRGLVAAWPSDLRVRLGDRQFMVPGSRSGVTYPDEASRRAEKLTRRRSLDLRPQPAGLGQPQSLWSNSVSQPPSGSGPPSA